MSDEDFEQKLKELREQYLEKQENNKKSSDTEQTDADIPVSKEEKRSKVSEAINLLEEKKLLLSDKLAELQQHEGKYEQISKLKHQLEALKYKESLLKQKLEYINSGESDFVKKERLKRQLTELELKRWRTLLSKKNSSKIEQKIKQKKELLRKIK